MRILPLFISLAVLCLHSAFRTPHSALGATVWVATKAVPVGTNLTEIPVNIVHDFDGETFTGLRLSFSVRNALHEDGDVVRVIRSGDEFNATLWGDHPASVGLGMFSDADPFTHKGLGDYAVMLGEWLEDPDQAEDPFFNPVAHLPSGVVATFTLLTGPMQPGIYTIDVNHQVAGLYPPDPTQTFGSQVYGAGRTTYRNAVLEIFDPHLVPEPDAVLIVAFAFAWLSLVVWLARHKQTGR